MKDPITLVIITSKTTFLDFIAYKTTFLDYTFFMF